MTGSIRRDRKEKEKEMKMNKEMKELNREWKIRNIKNMIAKMKMQMTMKM